ncbi:hypothetical protein HD806DRAFT_512409 [Xylariaceae sp. AK1471]|nr:hypothetical protein HD806DRAFT_512409 [Xylariaceae sp. AK1471]
MPVPIAAKAGVIAVSVAVAAAIAIYESPELQRMANDLRRRIAIALHTFGDSISPQERENLFNRPEDAEGFLESRGLGAGSVLAGVDADPESLQRQREELMYWNAIRESKKDQEKREQTQTEKTTHQRSRTSSSFDDFLQQDENEKGAFVFQTSHEPQNSEGLIRRRGADGVRGLNHSIYTNPFADEHGIDDDIAFENSLMDPEKDEMSSDIYSATALGAHEAPQTTTTMSPPRDATLLPTSDLSVRAPEFISWAEPQPQQSQPEPEPLSAPEPSETELGEDEYMTAGQEPDSNAYSSIQAWAQGASHNASFYSPLPTSTAPPSEVNAELGGALTPTDSVSVVDVANDELSSDGGVMSDDEGMMTPTSWTEVGSVVSESESGAVHA